MKSYITAFCTIFCMFAIGVVWFASSIFKVDYESSPDYRTRQYVNVTVIDMYSYESCNKSKTSCTNTNYFTIELSDKSVVERVYVTDEFYRGTKLGQIVAIERHIGDPIVRKQEDKLFVVRSIFCILAVVFFIILVCRIFGDD